jgi:hypothetical protein
MLVIQTMSGVRILCSRTETRSGWQVDTVLENTFSTFRRPTSFLTASVNRVVSAVSAACPLCPQLPTISLAATNDAMGQDRTLPAMNLSPLGHSLAKARDAGCENLINASTVEVQNLKPPAQGVAELPNLRELPKLIKHKARSGVVASFLRE